MFMQVSTRWPFTYQNPFGSERRGNQILPHSQATIEDVFFRASGQASRCVDYTMQTA
jgi:hypothetical protein